MKRWSGIGLSAAVSMEGAWLGAGKLAAWNPCWTVAYVAHALPLAWAYRVSVPMLHTGDRRARTHMFTTIAAADGLSLIATAPALARQGRPLLAAAGTVAWVAAAGNFVGFLRNVSTSRRHPSGTSADSDAVIVLGAGLVGDRPGRLLASRIDRAVQIAPHGVAVVMSGGQGDDEPVSEAVAMQNYLRDRWAEMVDAKRLTVLAEDGATNTRENLRFSVELLREQGWRREKIAVVTSDFHVERTRMTAREVEGLLEADSGPMRFEVWGAPTPQDARPAAYVREFAALTLWKLRGWVDALR